MNNLQGFPGPPGSGSGSVSVRDGQKGEQGEIGLSGLTGLPGEKVSESMNCDESQTNFRSPGTTR